MVRKYDVYESITLRTMLNRYGISIVITPKECNGKPLFANPDGIMHRNGDIIGVYEFKSRNMSYDTLTSKRYGSWLISESKIKVCREIAIQMCVPFYGFLFLIPDSMMFCWEITDQHGVHLVDLNIKRSKTKSNSDPNDSTMVWRNNAYLSMEDSYRV